MDRKKRGGLSPCITRKAGMASFSAGRDAGELVKREKESRLMDGKRTIGEFLEIRAGGGGQGQEGSRGTSLTVSLGGWRPKSGL